MRWCLKLVSIVISLLVVSTNVVEAQQQQLSDPPTDALVTTGPFALSPSMNATDIGYDSNIYGRDLSQGEKSDMTAKLTPAATAYLRLPHLKMNASGSLTFNYFQTNSNLRSTDSRLGVGFQVPLSRFTPYVSGNLTNVEQSSSVEIDAMARSNSTDGLVGLDVSVTPNLTLGVYAQHLRLEFDSDNQPYLGVDLARTLNHSSDRVGLHVLYTLTPYTTVGVDAFRQDDVFDDAFGSNSQNLDVKPFVEFSPSAVIGGRASIGFKQRRFDFQPFGETSGGTANVALSYLLLGHTRFSVAYDRELEYSYLALARQYLSNQVSVSALHRFNEAWDAMVSAGTAHIGYRDTVLPTDPIATPTPTDPTATPIVPPTPNLPPITPVVVVSATPPDEHIRMIDGNIGYSRDKTRTGLTVEYRTRRSDTFTDTRGDTRWLYRRLRIGLSVTHVF